MQLTKWVHEILWIPEVKVIFRPLREASRNSAILNIFSKVIEPTVAKVHIYIQTVQVKC